MGGAQSTPAAPVYAVPVTEPKDGESAVYRNAQFKDGLITEMRFNDGDVARTMAEAFAHGVKLSRDLPCLGKRPIAADGTAGDFEFITYAQTDERMQNFACGAAKLNLVPVNAEDKMAKLGIFSKNRMEWVIAQHACHRSSVVVVPLYDTLGTEAVKYVVNQTELTTIVAAAVSLDIVLEAKALCKSLKNVVCMDAPSEDQKAALEKAGLTVYLFEEVETTGRENPCELTAPKPEDVAAFCYTSGTTGDPKGAMETHRSVLADFSGGYVAGLQMGTDDVHLSYLPLAHMFEFIVQVGVLSQGGRIGFFQGDAAKLVADLQALRPTLFPSVPRLYNRIYDKIMGGVEETGGISKSIFMSGYESKKYYLQYGYLEHALWDTLVFKKVRAKVGLDRVRLMLTGSAPIAAHVLEFLRIVFGCPVQEGYGQTECAAAATISMPSDLSVGHVGGPIACNDIKLVDVADMGYTAKDKPFPRGEICFKGANLFAGYYKNKAKTDEAVDKDGWLHSGDIAMITDTGRVHIIDRKKNIFKLSQGEYVAAEKIENVYVKHNAIAQAFVYGDSLQSCLVGVFVVEPATLKAFAQESGVTAAEPADLATNDQVKKALLDSINALAKENGLKSFECVKALHIELTPWTPEDKPSLLTPTFKLKRKQAQEKYQSQIDDMYASGISVVGGKAGLKQADMAGQV